MGHHARGAPGEACHSLGPAPGRGAPPDGGARREGDRRRRRLHRRRGRAARADSRGARVGRRPGGCASAVCRDGPGRVLRPQPQGPQGRLFARLEADARLRGRRARGHLRGLARAASPRGFSRGARQGRPQAQGGRATLQRRIQDAPQAGSLVMDPVRRPPDGEHDRRARARARHPHRREREEGARGGGDRERLAPSRARRRGLARRLRDRFHRRDVVVLRGVAAPRGRNRLPVERRRGARRTRFPRRNARAAPRPGSSRRRPGRRHFRVS